MAKTKPKEKKMLSGYYRYEKLNEKKIPDGAYPGRSMIFETKETALRRLTKPEKTKFKK